MDSFRGSGLIRAMHVSSGHLKPKKHLSPAALRHRSPSQVGADEVRWGGCQPGFPSATHECLKAAFQSASFVGESKNEPLKSLDMGKPKAAHFSRSSKR